MTEQIYLAEKAWLNGRWQNNVCMQVDEQGLISSLTTNEGSPPEAIRLKGYVLPGMPNCHSHAFQRGFAGLSEYQANPSDSFWTWRSIMYQFVSEMTPEQLFTIARQLYLEMLQAGYSSVAEFHYLHQGPGGERHANPAEMSEAIIAAAKETGIGLTLLPVYYRYAGFGNKAPTEGQLRFTHEPEEYFALLEHLNQKLLDSSNMTLGIAPHSLRAVSPEDINEAVAVLHGLDDKAPVHIHIAEQTQEVDDCLAAVGARPVEYLLNECTVDDRWCLIHATHLSDEEIERLAASQAVAGLCPTTEANLGDGVFPAVDYLKSDGRIAVGSDSHISVNMLEELRILEYSQRLFHRRRALIASEARSSVGETLYFESLKGGAQCMNRPSGSLEEGKLADFICLDPEHPSLVGKPDQYLLDSLIFSVSDSPIIANYVAGRCVYNKENSEPLRTSTLAFKQVLESLIGR